MGYTYTTNKHIFGRFYKNLGSPGFPFLPNAWSLLVQILVNYSILVNPAEGLGAMVR